MTHRCKLVAIGPLGTISAEICARAELAAGPGEYHYPISVGVCNLTKRIQKLLPHGRIGGILLRWSIHGHRDNTIFVITPDCGRDANPLAEVPFQHHFNSRSAHETWAVVFGPGITRGTVDRTVDQSAIAPSIAAMMGFAADRAEGSAIEGMFA